MNHPIERRENLNTTTDAYIPIQQVITEWNVSKWFLLREMKSGRLNAYKLNGYKFKRSDLDSYLETRKVQPVTSKE